jgi:glycosyltransferase involved in cell wall biosynthesis
MLEKEPNSSISLGEPPRKSTRIKKKISVLIPVFNEERSVEALYNELLFVLKSTGYPYEIIFIDDGSTDQTLQRLKRLSPVTVLSFGCNLGKSKALQAGFDYADAEIILTIDGDLQDDPKEIPRFVEELQKGYDLVCGWKYKRQDPWNKRFFSKIANFVNRLITKTKIHDMNCCFKAYRKEVVKSLKLHGEMHRFIPTLAANEGFRVTEIKINHRPRLHGRSKYGFSRLLKGLFDFLTVMLLRKFSDRPMHYFGLLGGGLSMAGLVVLSYLSYLRLFLGIHIGGRPLLLFGILLLLMGLQFLSLGFIGELIIRTQGKDRTTPVIRKKFKS